MKDGVKQLQQGEWPADIALRFWDDAKDALSRDFKEWGSREISYFFSNLVAIAEGGNTQPLLQGTKFLEKVFPENKPMLYRLLLNRLLRSHSRRKFMVLGAVLQEAGTPQLGECLVEMLTLTDAYYRIDTSRTSPEEKPWQFLVMFLKSGRALSAQEALGLENWAILKMLTWWAAVIQKPAPLLEFCAAVPLSIRDIRDKDTLWLLALIDDPQVVQELLPIVLQGAQQEVLLHQPTVRDPIVYWHIARKLPTFPGFAAKIAREHFFGPIPLAVLEQAHGEGVQRMSLREALDKSHYRFLVDRVFFYNRLEEIKKQETISREDVHELRDLAGKGQATRCWQDLTAFLLSRGIGSWKAFKRISLMAPDDPEQYERFGREVAELEFAKAKNVDGTNPEKLRKHAWRAFQAGAVVKCEDTRARLLRRIAEYFVFPGDPDHMGDPQTTRISEILTAVPIEKKEARVTFHRLEEMRWAFNDRQRKEIMTFYQSLSSQALEEIACKPESAPAAPPKA